MRAWLHMIRATGAMFVLGGISLDAQEKELMFIAKEVEFKKAEIARIQARLDRLSAKLNEFGKLGGNAQAKEVVEVPTSKVIKIPVEESPDNQPDEQTEQEKPIEEAPPTSIKRSSFYIMPFIGLQKTNDLRWKAFSGTFQIKEKLGMSTGLMIGHDWGKYFADFQVSYFQNQMDGINIPLEFSGESSGVGFHFSGGGRIHFNDFISGMIGAGVGGIEHDVSFSLAGLSVKESDFLLSLHLFTGLELNPTQQSKVGLRYRWVMMEEMKLFSVHDLHLIEFYLGYNF